MEQNATVRTDRGRCPKTIPADADIAGIGVCIHQYYKFRTNMHAQVIISFGLSGFLTTAASLLASALYNDITLFFIRISNPQKRDFWLHVLDRIVLGLSDQQLVTGFSILLVGYIKLHERVPIYHFFCITNLAMFSCSVHLASVISLRRYFQNNPEVAWIRVAFMSVFALLLALSLSIFGAGLALGDSDKMSCPATCLPSYSSFGLSKIIGWFLVIYLAICYWAAYSYVFPNAEIFFTKWLFTKPLEFVEKYTGIYQFHERFMHQRPRFPSLIVSHMLQTLWWIVSFSLAILTRYWGVKNTPKFQEGDERSWGFGQLLALFLILLPLLSGVEILCGK